MTTKAGGVKDTFFLPLSTSAARKAARQPGCPKDGIANTHQLPSGSACYSLMPGFFFFFFFFPKGWWGATCTSEKKKPAKL